MSMLEQHYGKKFGPKLSPLNEPPLKASMMIYRLFGKVNAQVYDETLE